MKREGAIAIANVLKDSSINCLNFDEYEIGSRGWEILANSHVLVARIIDHHLRTISTNNYQEFPTLGSLFHSRRD